MAGEAAATQSKGLLLAPPVVSMTPRCSCAGGSPGAPAWEATVVALTLSPAYLLYHCAALSPLRNALGACSPCKQPMVTCKDTATWSSHHGISSG